MQVPHGAFTPRPTHLGQRLPEAVQQKMEATFGTDFSDVRIHTGPEAASIGALAFTMGSTIYFAPGQYNPTTSHGQRLIGHELAHVVQQRAGRVRNPFGHGVAVVQDPGLEAEADRMGMRAATTPLPANIVQRQASAFPGRGIRHQGVVQREKILESKIRQVLIKNKPKTSHTSLEDYLSWIKSKYQNNKKRRQDWIDSEEDFKALARTLYGSRWGEEEEDTTTLQETITYTIAGVNESTAHLDNSKFYRGAVTQKTPPDTAAYAAHVNGKRITRGSVSGGTAVPSETHTNDIKLPTGDLLEQTSDEDAEVKILITVLQVFKNHMANNDTSDSIDFELAILDNHGPCHGCKRRLIKFAGLWITAAQAGMDTGVQATLHVTSVYIQKPSVAPKRTKSGMSLETWYGWPDKHVGKGPHYYSLTANATGT